MSLAILRLKKNEDRRLRMGHVWIYSNEIDTKITPLKQFSKGQVVIVEAHDKTQIGIAFVNPHSLITGRLLTRDVRDHFDLDFLIRKLKIAYATREHLFAKPYYRLVFGESDGLPGLVVDRFGETLVVQINTAGMDVMKDFIISALRETIPDVTSILFRNDSQARQYEGLENDVIAGFGTPAKKVLLEENDTQFYAPIWDGQKTGWFYDHRFNRARLKDYVVNQRVLDVFSYLGAWGIQAAKFGAKEVTCVDSSTLSHTSIMEHADLNSVREKIRVITEDAFVALKNLHSEYQQFDVVILDPPAFIKKQKDHKEGLIAYQRINELALKLLAPGGILFSCSCSMHLTYDDLVQALRRAANRTHQTLQILERGHQAPDHPIHLSIPEMDYLKMIVVKSI